MNRAELWNRLCEAGVVSGEMPVKPADGQSSPWPVRLMLGIAGWIGALFLLGFALIAFRDLYRSVQAAVPTGVICCLAAFAIFHLMPRNEFMTQFAFAISLAGQGLLLIGLGNLNGNAVNVTFLVMAVIEGVLAWAVPNSIHRAFTTLAANTCLLIAFVTMGGPGLPTLVAAVGLIWVWLEKARSNGLWSFWEPIGYGFAIALLHMDGSMFIGQDLWRGLRTGGDPIPPLLLRSAQVVTSLLFFFVAWRLRERAGVAVNSRGGIAVTVGAVIVALCGLGAPGISAAALVLALGFANGDRVLMGLGVLAFAGYLSHFYYQMSSTLLVKSMVLAASGAALLCLWWAVERLLLGERDGDA